MTGFLGGSLIGVGQGGAIDTGDIQKSLRFAASRSTYLSRTPASAGNRKTWTWSGWVKRGALGASQGVFVAGDTAADSTAIDITSADKVRLITDRGSSNVFALTSAAVFRDPITACNLVVSVDTSQVIQTDRVKIWSNNVLLSLTGTYPALDYLMLVNGTDVHKIGKYLSSYLDGYLSRVCVVDGQALTPSSFITFNSEINEWVPKTKSAVRAAVLAGGGARNGWGANGSMQDFDNGTSLTTLGYDISQADDGTGGNHWTLNNHSLTAGVNYDWMDDVPGNSFATLNPLVGTQFSQCIEGNLRVITSITGVGGMNASIGVSSGKWYWEVYNGNDGAAAFTMVGIRNSFGSMSAFPGGDTNGYGYYGLNGNKFVNNANTAYGSTYTGNQTVGIGLDLDAGQITFYLDGVSQGVAFTSISTGEWFPAIGDGSTTQASNSVFLNFGQRPFAYTPPTGFKVLNQRNLPDGSSVTLSGSFTGNAAVDGPCVWLNGSPDTLTINGNAVTFGTHADRLATGFKVRSSSASYNTAGSNTYVAAITSNLKNCFKYNNAKDNT